ncbi:unnamed protein product (macronuclear) [Paramecium tetraurelia]|uniref:Tlde1 domain-containing protein n=1 Tax=Paramecium tetraurelia TaxID=5888 RepID=A0BGR1_PARTE|nr:uncharacterized protein GSPATT00028763001 [Paramecium tetraurelia]CAK57728.1 unnamed protein product [Paramecium tetraurelia]|eukprot:XP_001425126.1 hypothetical protein (macronuclear) [Paramecium tetraurelia strain d4-2]
MKYYIILCLVAATLAGSCGQTCCQDLKTRAAMTYHYYINTGRFVGGSGDSAIKTFGYSGSGQYRNDPASMCIKNKGPAPATTYKITLCKNTMHNPPVDRPCSFWIEAVDEKTMCGRSEIFIHGCQCCSNGDWTEPPVDGCSAGCVIINEANRKKLRVGDTIIIEQRDPLGDDVQFLEDYSQFAQEE